jgi:RNA polymerase sigma factor (sigma-70 family)
VDGTTTPGAGREFSVTASGSALTSRKDQGIRECPLSAKQQAVFSNLYRDQHEAVLRLLKTRLDNEQDAADLAQEAFLRMLRYRHCDARSLTFLLFRVALNLAVSHGRLSRVRCDVSLGDRDFADNMPGLEEQLIREETLTRVSRAVQGLPERCRQAFTLSRIDGLRQHEIARRCGISRRMVEYHIAHAQAVIRGRAGE